MIDNAEVLAAAERVRLWKIWLNAPLSPEPSPYYGSSYYVADDKNLLSDWAASHLDAQRKREEERARPVTEEWLRSIGFVDDPSGGSRCLCAANGLNRVSYLIVTGQWFVNDRGIFETRLNRGMTEDLLRGLGIEPAKGGGA